jgi:hypothetical protein
MGTQTMFHKHPLWIEKPLPDAHRGNFGNSGDFTAKGTALFPNEIPFLRRSVRFWSAADRGTAMEEKNDRDGGHTRRPLRSFRRRCGRDGRWGDGRAASGGGSTRVTAVAAGAERLRDREPFSGPFQSVAAPAGAGAEKTGNGPGKWPDLCAHFVSADGALGRQWTILPPRPGHWYNRLLRVTDLDGSKVIASGDNEAIDKNPVGGASVEMVVESGHACREVLLQGRPDAPFGAPGFVRAEDILRLRARNPAQRLSANHRCNVDRTRKACMEVVETVWTLARWSSTKWRLR